jgi:polar amino acid transport system substrate-binding protein
MLLPALACAACSRPIVVPASALGKMMAVNPATQEVSGVYPDLLRERGRRAGCQFMFPIVPRARAEAMMRQGDGDLFVGAIKVPERESWGQYVALLGTEWMLVSTMDQPPRSVDELLALPGIRVNAVRSYNYGPAYQAMLAALERAGKLEYVPDAETIARKMQAGRADFTYMPSNTFAGAMDEAGLRGTLGPRVRYTRLAGLPASSNGAYLSRRLAAADAEQLTAILLQLRDDGALIARIRQEYTAADMVSLYPLPRGR